MAEEAAHFSMEATVSSIDAALSSIEVVHLSVVTARSILVEGVVEANPGSIVIRSISMSPDPSWTVCMPEARMYSLRSETGLLA